MDKERKKEFSLNDDFWQEYLDACSEEDKFSISEKVTSNKPQLSLDIAVDFVNDISNNDDITNELDQFIKVSLDTLYSVMEQNITIDKFEPETTCYYLRRNLPIIKNRFSARLFFPNCRLKKDEAEKLFYQFQGFLKSKFGENMIISAETKDSIDDMFKLTSFNYRMLYGSYEDKNPPLFMNNVYIRKDKETLISEDEVNLSRFPHDVSGDPSYCFPIVFSDDYAKDHITNIKGRKKERNTSRANTTYKTKTIEDYKHITQVEKIDTFLDLLDVSRAENYHDWIDVGEALTVMNYNFDDDENLGLERWKEFTSRGKRFTPEDCEEKWDTLLDTSNTANTIEYFAYCDNREMYEEYMSAEREDALNQAVSRLTPGSVASLFKMYFPFKFLCSDFRNKNWYYYSGLRWQSDGSAVLTEYVKKLFIPIINEYRQRYNEEFDEELDRQNRRNINSKITKITKLIEKLENPSFENNVINSLRIEYYNKNFENIKNTIPEFTGFRNCIIDVRSGIAVGRKGKPEDFITKISRTPYNTKLNWNSSCVKEVKKYMEEVFRNPEKREFVYRLISSFLFARNSDKIVVSLCGIGDNSKSILVKIMREAFGDYVGNVPASILTEKRTSSDGATPGLIRVTGCRGAMIQEPDRRDPIRTGTIKELTGGDTYATRELFQKGSDAQECIPTFIPFIITNHKLTAHDTQQAFWNRVVHITFESKWLKEGYPETYEEQLATGRFPMDSKFDKSLMSKASGLVWLACQYYTSYHRDGLQIPSCVKDASEDLRKINNFYIGFVKDCMVKTNEDDDVIKVRDAYNAFKNWFAEQSYTAVRPNLQDFVENIDITIKQEIKDRTWTGWTIVTEELLIGEQLGFN